MSSQSVLDIFPPSFLLELLLSNYFTVSAYLVVLYDIIITFDEEVLHIWKGKFSVVTVIFFINRYAGLVNSVGGLYNVLFANSASSCIVTNFINQISLLILGIASPIFSAYRAWVICNHSWSLFISIILFGIVSPIFIGASTVISARKSENFEGRVSSVMFELITLLTILVKHFKHWRSQVRLGIKTSYAELLIRDGSLYFGVILTLNIVVMITDEVLADVGNPLSSFVAPVTCICISRLIISPKNYQRRTMEDTTDPVVSFGNVLANLE
ncbi:hypothetical protein C8Q75DRAFT_827071 [Abortiporus biennis]|nr:hypothetical protein C8Q75DRAFT_827071 [Abortiporus biennis]